MKPTKGEIETRSNSWRARGGHEIPGSKPTTSRNILAPLNWFFPVVGTGVDPVTSRFSDRNAEKDNSCGRPAGGSKGAGKSENFIPAMVLGVWPCSALFRVPVGTLWARSLTNLKHLTSKNAQDGSHRVAEARSPDGEQYKVLIERSVARGDGSVSG